MTQESRFEKNVQLIEDSPFMTVPETARFFRISERTLWNRTTPRGGLVATRFDGRVLYHKDDIQAYIEACRDTAEDREQDLD